MQLCHDRKRDCEININYLSFYSEDWYEYGLKLAVKAGNTAAMNYLFKQIHSTDKSRVAEDILKYVFNSNMDQTMLQ